MKKGILILVMITIATTAFNQSSRRTTNVNSNSSRTSSRASVYASNTNSSRVSRSDTRHSTPHKNHSHSKNSSRNSKYRNTSYTYYNSYAHNRNHTVHYNYRVPTHVNVVWTSDMHRHYVNLYPKHINWNCNYGHRIASIPAHKAEYYMGSVRNVYGRVSEVFYSHQTDEYILYIGGNFPHQQFTVVVPGNIARRKSHRPDYYYMNQHINVTGLISSFEGKAEVIVMRNSQINVY